MLQLITFASFSERAQRGTEGDFRIGAFETANGISLRWLLSFIRLYEQLPSDLNFQIKAEAEGLIIYTLESEIDEMLNFVANKQNKKWISMAMGVKSRQIVAFHVRDRSRQSAKALLKLIPFNDRNKATFYTDGCQAYAGVIPENQHHVVKKQRRKTNHIERFNCTLRQRVSPLVRKSISFSKQLANHICLCACLPRCLPVRVRTQTGRRHQVFHLPIQSAKSITCIALPLHSASP